MKFLCAGDLHLGAGADLGNAPGERLAEQATVLGHIVDLANELDAMLLWAGDAWEHPRPTPAELLAFIRPLEGLRRGVRGIAGNHDVEAFERPTGYDLIDETILGMPGIEAVPWLVGDTPERVEAIVACLPWATPSRLVALEAGGDRDALNERLAEGLVDIARGLFVKATDWRSRFAANAEIPIVLLAHWSVGGASTPTGVPAELFREAVLDAAALDAIGFDAVVLGHIHKPQTLDVGDGRRPMFYVGSPMPLNFGEAQSDHSVTLLDVEAGRPAQVFQIPIESRRLVSLTMNGGKPIGDALYDWSHSAATAWKGYRDAVVKVKVEATAEQARRFNAGALRHALLTAGAHKVWAIQTEIERDAVVRVAGIDETIGDEEAFALWLDAAGLDEPTRSRVEEDLIELHLHYLEEAQNAA